MKNFIKKLVLIFSIIFCGNIFLINFSFVEATSNIQVQVTEQEELAKKIKGFQKLGQALYTITWPLIVISGKFMDNGIIYGSFLGMDSLLWKVWNIMRTFANYLIGFILIFSIFTLFLGGKLEQFNPIKIIPQLAIAALLVNASWFLIGFMIDVSNILTYSIGTLPLKLADTKKVYDHKIPEFGIKFQDDSENFFKVGIMDGETFLPFCEYKPVTGGKFITKGECAFEYMGKYYKYASGATINLSNPGNGGTLIESGKTFGDIQKKLGGMTGILGTLYASVINIGASVSYPSGSSIAMIGDVIFKLLFLLALIIPLFTLAIILIVRAVLLWMFIVLSPIIFLFTPIKSLEKVLGEKGKLTNLISLIFMPVVVVFALSISFIFLSYLKYSEGGITDTFGFQLHGTGVVIPLAEDKNITISYKGNDSASLFSNIGNTFVWLIENIFAIAFMWILVFSALKTSKLTSKIATSINNFSINMAKATPIVPIAGGQSISSLGQGIKTVESLPGTWQNEQFSKKLQPIINEIQRKISGEETAVIKSSNEKIKNTVLNGGLSTNNYNEQVVNNIGSFLEKNNISNIKISDLLKDNKKLTTLAGQLKISTYKLKEILGKYNKDNKNNKNKKLGDVIPNIANDLKKAFEDASREKLKKLLSENVLSKDITLLQLDNEAKDKLKELFNQVGVGQVNEIGRNEETVKALKELGFTKKEVIKLLSDNLEGSKPTLKKEDENQIKNWYGSDTNK